MKSANKLGPVEILYEDDNYIAINKPAGLVVHPDGKTNEKTLVDIILKERPEMKGVGEPLELTNGTLIERPGILHRLDRDTSGVLLLAKNQMAYGKAKKQFQNRDTMKSYRAFVWGTLKENEATINVPIAKSRGDFRKWTSERGQRGEQREAITAYRVLGRFEAGGELFSYIDVRPLTGRTHQIRVHMKAKGHPVVSDSLYAPRKPKMLGFERQALHARTFAFTNLEGEEIAIEAPLPKDFLHALKENGLAELANR
jgi:23S rRNA pseudouridine1911/1915/1917 synthase